MGRRTRMHERARLYRRLRARASEPSAASWEERRRRKFSSLPLASCEWSRDASRYPRNPVLRQVVHSNGRSMTWRVGTLKWGHENFGNFKVFFTNFGETSRSFGAGEASAEPSFDSMRHSLCWRAPSPRPPIPLSLSVQRARPWAGGAKAFRFFTSFLSSSFSPTRAPWRACSRPSRALLR